MLVDRKPLKPSAVIYTFILLSLGFATSCGLAREYQDTWYTFKSPTGINYIYLINTQGSGGWGPWVSYLYFSDDLKGATQLPKPRYRIALSSRTGLQHEVGYGCLQVLWKNDYEATIRYCVDGGIFPKTTQFKFKDNQITLHFERAANCKPEEVTDLLYKLKGEKNLCRYYFPEEKPQQSLIVE